MSSRHSKLAAGRKDMYYYMAKETGYRSRAAFKLVQLDQKFDLLSSAKCLIDLCAAPGGWSQVAIKNMPIGSVVIAVDLDPIKPIPGLQAFQSDITSKECRSELIRLINKTPVDVVVHDGAPNVSGDYELDSFNQNVLVLWALKLASEFLKQGGVFVTKIFRSGEMLQLQYVLKQLFEQVDITKPKSSRDSSAEIFAVCRGFKGQFAELDQKLFDPEIVLGHKQISAGDVNIKQLEANLDKSKRHRGGYEDTLARKFTDLVTFVISSNPVTILAKYNVILTEVDVNNDFRFQDLKNRILTDGIQFNKQKISTVDEYNEVKRIILESMNEEIKEILMELKEISQSNLRSLMLWRQRTLTKLQEQYKSNDQAIIANLNIIQNEQQSQYDLVKIQEELIAQQKQRELRKSTRLEQKKLRQRARKMAVYEKDLLYDRTGDEGYQQVFNDKVRDQIQTMDPEVLLSSSESESDPMIDNAITVGNKRVVFAVDDDGKDEDLFDQQMNELYDQYITKKKELETKLIEREKQAAITRGLTVDLAEQWFGQDQFAQFKNDKEKLAKMKKQQEDDDEEFASHFPLPREVLRKTKDHIKRVQSLQKQARQIALDNKEIDLLRQEHKYGAIQIVQDKKGSELEEAQKTVKPIEIVRSGDESSIDSSNYSNSDGNMLSEEEILEEEEEKNPEIVQSEEKLHVVLNKQNIDDSAMKLALAKQLLHKKSRRALEESAYNRHTFYKTNDHDSKIPDWFKLDEMMHCQPQRQVTAEEVANAKAQLMEMQQMPHTKKERESVARKKMHAYQKYNDAQDKTQSIINREDLTETEKARLLRKLQSSLKPPKQKKKLVYSNMHRDVAMQQPGKKSRGMKFTDKRMKHENRMLKRIEKKRGKAFKPGK